MIGGTDIVISAIGDAAALEACVRVIQQHWPDAKFENAISGDKYHGIREIPVDRVTELLAYPDADAEAAWDSESSESAPNSMLYLILSESSVTIVVDDPSAPEMQRLVDSIRAALRPIHSGSR